MNPCLRCGKRREHAFHDPRARVYREDRHEYWDGYVICGRCSSRIHWMEAFPDNDWELCQSCYEALKAVTA